MDLPGPRGGLGAALCLYEAALEQSCGWEVGGAELHLIDLIDSDWMNLEFILTFLRISNLRDVLK